MKGLNSRMFWYNLKLLPVINIVICVFTLIVVQIVFSLKMIDFRGMADIGELFVSLLGIILIPGLVFVDVNSEVKEIIYSKAVSPVFPLKWSLCQGHL